MTRADLLAELRTADAAARDLAEALEKGVDLETLRPALDEFVKGAEGLRSSDA